MPLARLRSWPCLLLTHSTTCSPHPCTFLPLYSVIWELTPIEPPAFLFWTMAQELGAGSACSLISGPVFCVGTSCFPLLSPTPSMAGEASHDGVSHDGVSCDGITWQHVMWQGIMWWDIMWPSLLPTLTLTIALGLLFPISVTQWGSHDGGHVTGYHMIVSLNWLSCNGGHMTGCHVAGCCMTGHHVMRSLLTSGIGHDHALDVNHLSLALPSSCVAHVLGHGYVRGHVVVDHGLMTLRCPRGHAAGSSHSCSRCPVANHSPHWRIGLSGLQSRLSWRPASRWQKPLGWDPGLHSWGAHSIKFQASEISSWEKLLLITLWSS